jgi:hypothetical protein
MASLHMKVISPMAMFPAQICFSLII